MFYILMESFPTLETIRPDGLRIITKKLENTRRALISIHCLHGSANDPEDRRGLFHFYEHMAFKGTKAKTEDQISGIFERYSLDHDAYTSRVRTSFNASGVDRHTEIVGELLFDMYLNASFPEAEIGKEKEVIYNEIAQSQDNDYHELNKKLGEVLWDKNPQKYPILGTNESVANITRDTLIQTREASYIPSNTVVLAVGNIEHDSIRKNADRDLPLSDKKVEKIHWNDESSIPPKEKEVVVEKSDLKKVGIIYTSKIQKMSDKDWATIQVLMRMLGKGSDSMMFQEVRKRRGYAYSTGGGMIGLDQLGWRTYFFAETLPQTKDQAKNLIPEIIFRQPLNPEHFERVREGFIDYWLVSRETPGSWEESILDLVLDTEKPVSDVDQFPIYLVEVLSQMTIKDVEEIRHRLLLEDSFVCGILQPKK